MHGAIFDLAVGPGDVVGVGHAPAVRAGDDRGEVRPPPDDDAEDTTHSGARRMVDAPTGRWPSARRAVVGARSAAARRGGRPSRTCRGAARARSRHLPIHRQSVLPIIIVGGPGWVHHGLGFRATYPDKNIRISPKVQLHNTRLQDSKTTVGAAVERLHERLVVFGASRYLPALSPMASTASAPRMMSWSSPTTSVWQRIQAQHVAQQAPALAGNELAQRYAVAALVERNIGERVR